MDQKAHFRGLAEKGIDYLEIKKKVDGSYLPEEEKKAILKDVRDTQIEKELTDIKKAKVSERIILGAILTVIGLFITLGSGFNIFAFGALGIGMGILIQGLTIKENLDDYDLVPDDERPKRLFDRF